MTDEIDDTKPEFQTALELRDELEDEDQEDSDDEQQGSAEVFKGP